MSRLHAVTPALSRDRSCAKLFRLGGGQLCAWTMASGFQGTIYTGVIWDLPGRIVRHRERVFGGFAQRCDVGRLARLGTADTMDAAIAAANRIKRWRRDWNIALIERANPYWNDQASVIGKTP